MFGFGLRYKLERVRSLCGLLWRSLTSICYSGLSLGERNEFLRQRDYLRTELEQLQRQDGPQARP